jgi:hypothetical protein
MVADLSWFGFREEERFPLSKTSNPRKTMPSYYRIERTGRENDQSLPSRAEVKNAWMFASNFPQYL